MENETVSSNQVSWTWADQISSYRFWGLFLFYLLLIIPNIILNVSYPFFTEMYGLSAVDLGMAMAFRSVAGFGGFWLAWFLIRMKNHFLLYLFSCLTIIGLILIVLSTSIAALATSFFLIGLGFGAISLAVPAIIAGGKGGSEMFVVSFGLITFYELLVWTSYSGLTDHLFELFQNPASFLIMGIVSSVLGTLLLIPVKAEPFAEPPAERDKVLPPVQRDPVIMVLLCLIPLYNIYYILHISYRLHGEVNSIHPTRKILSPRAALWSTLLLSVLSPMIVSSLNTNLAREFEENNLPGFHRNGAIIFWSFLFIPVSYALIQANLNRLVRNTAAGREEPVR